MNILQLVGNQILWAGSEDSLMHVAFGLIGDEWRQMRAEADADRAEFLASRKTRRAARAATSQAVTAALIDTGVRVSFGDDEDDEEEEKQRFSSAPLTITPEGVGIITVNGPLVNSDKWYLKYLGTVGYPHIQDSLVRAWKNPEVKSILMAYKTPGGAVSGIGATVDAIRALNVIKPVSSFGDGMIASGGYWLGTATSELSAADLTQIGSIGVVVTHMDYSKMLAQQGITPTVLRKGEYKHLVTPLEPLSDKAIAEIKKDMNVIYDAFTSSVAHGMDVSQSKVQKSWGEGKVFWTEEAKSLGMIKSVGTLSDAVANSAQLAENRAKQASGQFHF